MPNLSQRTAHESTVFAAVARNFVQQRNRTFKDKTPSFGTFEQNLAKELNNHLSKVFRISAEQLAKEQKVIIPRGKIVRQAQTRGKSFSNKLVRRILRTSRQGVADARKELFRAPPGKLEKKTARVKFENRIAALFNTNRAEGIAITEVTRAAIAGEDWAREIIEDELRKKLRPFWVTQPGPGRNDARVCPICRPLSDLPEKRYKRFKRGKNGPPAHVGCRCWLIYK